MRELTHDCGRTIVEIPGILNDFCFSTVDTETHAMKTTLRSFLTLPALLLAAGLLTGCGAEAPPANLPESKPATLEDIKATNAKVEAGRAGMRSPGVPNAPSAK